MGQIADVGNQAETRQVIDQLTQVRKQSKQVAGQIINLAASYRAIRSQSQDDDDTAFLDGKLAESVIAIKADMDALDGPTRAIVDQVIDGVFGPRT